MKRHSIRVGDEAAAFLELVAHVRSWTHDQAGAPVEALRSDLDVIEKNIRGVLSLLAGMDPAELREAGAHPEWVKTARAFRRQRQDLAASWYRTRRQQPR